jgi:hypothetical protein
VQDAQVFLGRPRRLPLDQEVVGHAEAAGGEQVRPIAVVGEGPRLANQPVDKVPVVDRVLAPPTQPGQVFHPPLGVPDLDPLGEQARLDPLADQPAGHRVDVALHPDGAARLHPHPQPLARLQATVRQGPQQGHLLGQAGLPSTIALGEQLPQEGRVTVAAGEVPAPPQHQGLVQRLLEAVVALLDVAVLVALARLDRLSLKPVVAQQGLVASLENIRVGPRLHGRRQPVGAVQLRHAAQLPQSVLQALAEALQAFGEAEGAGLPVGVGQHEVVDQVSERHPVEGHAQFGAVGEVAGRQPTGMMHLGEKDLLGWTEHGPPLLDPPLQSSQLTIGKTFGVLPLQGLEEGLGLQAGVLGQLFLDPGPDRVEGILACPPGVLHAYLAGQLVQPQVFACGLAVDPGLGSGQRQRRSLLPGLAETSHLLVGDHWDSFPVEESQWYPPVQNLGTSNCRQPGRGGDF